MFVCFFFVNWNLFVCVRSCFVCSVIVLVIFCVVSCVCSFCLCGMSVFVSYVWGLLLFVFLFLFHYMCFLFVFECMCLRMCVDNLLAG